MAIRAALFGVLATTSLTVAGTTSATVTFHKDVLPVLQKNCQECHRPGEAAPMSFLTYEQTRPWAKAIKAAVLNQKMPPWFADPHYGKFSNEKRLSENERKVLVAWADAGAPAGNAKQSPPPAQWIEGWNIPKPDVVIEMPKPFPVQASGTIEYQYVILPTGFTEDKWIQMAEARPGNRAVTHHIIAFIRPKGSPWMKDAEPGVPFVPKRQQRQARQARNGDPQAGEESPAGAELLVGYAPGMEAARFKPGQAKLVPAGADIVLQLHYTANGKETTDQTRVGLVFAKEPVKERILTMNATNARFVIPPGADNHQVDSQITLKAESRLVSLMPHMHLRGKSFQYTVIYPSGEKEVLLNVPKYDFNWQFFYYLTEEKLLPKGSRIECVAHFDNSRNNPANPDATKEVRWGDQSWEEMMIGWFEVAIDPKANPIRLFREEKPATGAE